MEGCQRAGAGVSYTKILSIRGANSLELAGRTFLVTEQIKGYSDKTWSLSGRLGYFQRGLEGFYGRLADSHGAYVEARTWESCG